MCSVTWSEQFICVDRTLLLREGVNVLQYFGPIFGKYRVSAKKKTFSINYPSFALVTLRLEMASYVILRMLIVFFLRGHPV